MHQQDGVSVDLVAIRFSWTQMLLDWKGEDFSNAKKCFEFRDKTYVLWRVLAHAHV